MKWAVTIRIYGGDYPTFPLRDPIAQRLFDGPWGYELRLYHLDKYILEWVQTSDYFQDVAHGMQRFWSVKHWAYQR